MKELTVEEQKKLKEAVEKMCRDGYDGILLILLILFYGGKKNDD